MVTAINSLRGGDPSNNQYQRSPEATSALRVASIPGAADEFPVIEPGGEYIAYVHALLSTEKRLDAVIDTLSSKDDAALKSKSTPLLYRPAGNEGSDSLENLTSKNVGLTSQSAKPTPVPVAVNRYASSEQLTKTIKDAATSTDLRV